ncbi:uncharacterized protein RCO7_11447 [Rhynchosporium graminicola]|uniref:Uncharacterized protein n=1 Tax=Rhynchosporium graminicola TaxID=2792576 RepID=A0A1E1LHS4_9HELO|nr:uncharacterized protein RCO7_11447 [Rhynchosporium commune]
MKGSETCKSFIGVRVLNADNTTIYRGTWFKSANFNPRPDEEGSNKGSEADVRSLSDSSYDSGSPASKESEPLSREIAEMRVEPDASEATGIPEAELMLLAEEEDLYLSKKKKDKKKSKV